MKRLLPLLMLFGTALSACSPAAAPTPTLSADPPIQPRCVTSAPGHRMLIVVSTSPSNTQQAEARAFCDNTTDPGWARESLDVSMDGYGLICEGKPAPQVVMAVWSMPDEFTLGKAYNVCGVFKNVTFTHPR